MKINEKLTGKVWKGKYAENVKFVAEEVHCKNEDVFYFLATSTTVSKLNNHQNLFVFNLTIISRYLEDNI